MPAGVHSFYLRECYLANKLSQGKMVLDNVRIDLKKVKIPIYNLAARDDHIAPLQSVFRVGQHMGGPTRLVVSGSGHIAGVVNPPAAKKYQYWTNPKPAATLEEWLKGATEHPGSWWEDWYGWISERSGLKVPAPTPGSGKLDGDRRRAGKLCAGEGAVARRLRQNSAFASRFASSNRRHRCICRAAPMTGRGMWDAGPG